MRVRSTALKIFMVIKALKAVTSSQPIKNFLCLGRVLFWLAALYVIAPAGYAISSDSAAAENFQKCRYGQVRQGYDCVDKVAVEGGAWHGNELFCQDGFAKLEQRDGTLRCYKLPDLTNGQYRGPIAQCPRNFVLVNWKCMPKSMVRDRSLIMASDQFCPTGYQELGDRCIPERVQQRKIVRDLAIQGVRLGMTEEHAFANLLGDNYEHFEDPTAEQQIRSFKKIEADGALREVMIRLNGSPLTIYEILYKQKFPTTGYDYPTVKQLVEQFYGPPIETRYYRERDLLVYRDSNSSSEPRLEIRFLDSEVVFHMKSRSLEIKLINQARKKQKSRKQLKAGMGVMPAIKF